MHTAPTGARTGPRSARLTLAAAVVVSLAIAGLAGNAHADPVSCADGGVCALGDTGPGGGTVFFVKSDGAFQASRSFPDTSMMCIVMRMCNDTVVHASLTALEQAALPFEYLEVAPASAQVDLAWDAGDGDVPGATSRAVGAGASNTAAILATRPDDSPAAHYTDAYTNDGQSDWFLPSADELVTLLVARQVFSAAMGSFPTLMWPSNQQGEVEVWARSMVDGSQRGNYKHVAYGVRPIRAFSAAPVSTTTTTTEAVTTTTTTTEPVTTTTTVPVSSFELLAPPVTTPLPAPPAPPVVVRAGSGSASTAILITDGVAAQVPLPTGAPPSGLAASAAIDVDRSIAVAPNGAVWTSDPADDHGHLSAPLNRPIVGIQTLVTAGADGPIVTGYWLVASDGGVFSFGSARFHGSTGARKLNGPVVGMAATPSGRGYWLMGADGGVFTFGDARFHGSLGSAPRTERTAAMATTSSGDGYWLVGARGRVSAFGDAAFHGSGSASAATVGVAASPTGDGYWLVGADGTLTGYGDVAG